MISRTVVNKSSDVMLKLHKSLVHSHVEYCTPVWSPCYQKDKILIERVQHRFTRMIPVFSKLPLKDLNLWDFWVWKKGGTEQIWLKFSKWLKDFLQYHWNLCSSYLPPHISEVMNTSWPNIEPNWKRDGTFSPSDLEQSGSAHIECRYCECFQEWSAAT